MATVAAGTGRIMVMGHDALPLVVPIIILLAGTHREFKTNLKFRKEKRGEKRLLGRIQLPVLLDNIVVLVSNRSRSRKVVVVSI